MIKRMPILSLVLQHKVEKYASMAFAWLFHRELEMTAQSLKGVEEEKKGLQTLTEALQKTLEVGV